jgi:hypothetical protein
MEEDWSFLAWSETDWAEVETVIRTPTERIAKRRIIFSPGRAETE